MMFSIRPSSSHTFRTFSTDSITSELEHGLHSLSSVDSFNSETATRDEFIGRVVELAVIAHQALIEKESCYSGHDEGVCPLTQSRLRDLEDTAILTKQRYIAVYQDLDKRFFHEFFRPQDAEKKALEIMNKYYYERNFEAMLCKYFEDNYDYKGDDVFSDDDDVSEGVGLSLDALSVTTQGESLFSPKNRKTTSSSPTRRADVVSAEYLHMKSSV